MAKNQRILHCINFDNVFIKPDANFLLADENLAPKYSEKGIIINGKLEGGTINSAYDESKIDQVMEKICSTQKYLASNLEEWKKFLETLLASGSNIAIIGFGSTYEVITKALELIGLQIDYTPNITIVTGIPDNFTIPKNYIERQSVIKHNPNYFFDNVLGYHIKAAMKYFSISSLKDVMLYDTWQHLIEEAIIFGIPQDNAFCIDHNSKDFTELLKINAFNKATKEITNYITEHGGTIRASGTIAIDLTTSYNSNGSSDSALTSSITSDESINDNDLKIGEVNINDPVD